MKIEKKCWPKEFQEVYSGKKNFEARLNDFECNVGDILVLKEFDPEKQEYTGRKIEKEITIVRKTKDFNYWKKEDVDKYGFQILQLK